MILIIQSIGQASTPIIKLYSNGDQEVNVIKEFDSSAYLNCLTKYGYPFPSIKWFKNNVEM